jgi:hypothetical protein
MVSRNNLALNCSLNKNKIANYHVKIKVFFHIITSNPQMTRGNMEKWKITLFGHTCKRKNNTRINKEIRSSLSRKRITVSLKYAPTLKE